MLAIAAVAACTPQQPSSNGPETDFWGNPIVCAVNGGAVTNPPPPPGAPPALPAGWRQVVIEVEVNAIGHNERRGINPVCVPFDVHLYGRADEAELIFFEGGKATTTPWDGHRVTPWKMTAYPQYNPAARPALVTWSVEILATYHPDHPDAALDPVWLPVDFSCDVFVDGRSKFARVLDPTSPHRTYLDPAKANLVTCQVADQA